MKEDLSASGILTPDGIWTLQAQPRAVQPRPALFLDRDGVLVKEVHYLHRVEDVQLEVGAAALVRWANLQAIPVVVVTNQSGIDRGMFGWTEFEAVQQRVVELLAGEGARLDLVIACPFHPQHTAGWGERQAMWRKPGAGMFQLSFKLLNILHNVSWMVGDTEGDMAAARAAGLAGGIHLLTGHGPSHRTGALGLNAPEFRVLPAADPAEALGLLQARFVAQQ